MFTFDYQLFIMIAIAYILFDFSMGLEFRIVIIHASLSRANKILIQISVPSTNTLHISFL